MKKILLALLVISQLVSKAQTYNPSIAGVPTNLPIAVAQAASTDSRSRFYDATNFVFRDYISTAEVLSYLNLSKYREGGYDIMVNSGGSLSGGGIITGGTRSVYWFRNGTADANLVLKVPITSVNGQTGGAIIVKNADSLKGQPIDTSVRRNGYAVTYDSVARKYYLAPVGTGGVYTGSSTIDVTGTVISALNTAALWNASQLRGRSITTNTPVQYQVLQWTGTEFGFANAGPSNALFTNDTIYIVRTPGDTIKLGGVASIHYVDSVVATIPLNPDVEHDATMTGTGRIGDVLRSDTNAVIATKYDIAYLQYQIDTATHGGGGIDTVSHDITMTGQGIPANKLKTDTSVIATQSWVNTNFIAPTIPTVAGGTGITVSAGPNYIVTATGTPTSNPFKALSIESYGGVADAVVPGTGSVATGTNNTTALNSMMTAAADGQLIIIPSGSWLFSSTPNVWQNKKMNLLILGTTYHNGVDFIRIVAPSPLGPDRFHIFRHMGKMIGRVNMPSHTKTTHDNGTAPVWNTFTGAAVTITDNDANQIFFNEVEGFYTAIDIVGTTDGSQENTITFERLYKNAVGITIRSTTGVTFCDKNAFLGPEGGTGRISGGLAIKIDGWPSPAPNGEIYNGAFRADRFNNILIEQVDSIMRANGDITEPYFNIMVESGTTTGVFGNTGFQIRSVSPNFMRGASFIGCEFFCTQWMTQGMGIDTRIMSTPTYIGCSTYLGSDAYGDGAGNLTYFVKASLSQATRASAPSNFKFLNFGEPQTDVDISAGTYTVASGIYWVRSSNTSATITLPTASSFPTREIILQNTATSGSMTVSNVISGSTTTIYPGKAITYRSNGTSWYSLDNGSKVNQGSISGYIWVTDGTTNGGSYQQNDGGWTTVRGTSSSAFPTTLATIPTVSGTAGFIEAITVGYYSTSGQNYTKQQTQPYVNKSNVLTFKGSGATLSSYTADFTPSGGAGIVFVSNSARIYISSVASETISWCTRYRVTQTSTVE